MATSNLTVSKNWKLPFFTIWSGQAFSLLGSQLVQFALVWWLTKTTGSATVLVTATLVAMLPQVVVGPFAGALVDRWSRRIVMMVADSLTALAVVALAVLFWTGQVQIWHVYVLMLLRAVGGSFHWPAMQASTSLMVPKEHLSRVQGLNQMLQGLMNIGAAPLGALLMGLLPMQAVLSIDVITAALAVLPLFFVAIPQPEPSASAVDESKPSLVGEMKAGFRYVWGWAGLMMIVVMAAVINMLLTPAGSLQPILVTRHFGGDAFGLAWLESAFGIGLVAGGLTLSAWGGFKRRILTSMLGLVILGLAVLGMGLLPASAFPLAVVLSFVFGFANPVVNGPLFAVVQAVVAPNMQGRVFTLISSFATAMSPLGLIVAGPLADRFGVQSWYLVGGVVTVLMGVGGLFIPAIMNIESEGDRSDPQAPLDPTNGELVPVTLKVELE